jgi:ubiquinone/menaquinone biosynthesis C-methylase UbiE
MNPLDTIQHYKHFNEICPDILTFFNHGYYTEDPEVDLSSDYFNGYQKSLYQHLLKNLVTENKNILDVGCGRGGAVNMFKTGNYGFAGATGIDISEDNISFANRVFKDDSYYVMDAHNISFNNSTFDIVTNVESMHCYDNPQLFLIEVRRVLDSNGVFVVTDTDASLEKHLASNRCPFRYIDREDITDNIVAACMRMGERFLNIESSPFRDNMLYITEKAAFYYANRIWSYVTYTCYNDKSVFKDNK